MSIAKIVNGAVFAYPVSAVTEFANTSFPSPITQESLPTGYVLVATTKTPSTAWYESYTEATPVLSNGVWTQAWSVQTIFATLADAQAANVARISGACGTAIVSGFTSNALGAPYTYPSKQTDQANLNASVSDSQLAAAAPAWSAGATVVAATPTTAATVVTSGGVSYICVQGGVTGAAAPKWPAALGATVTDGTAVWAIWTTSFWCADASGNWAWRQHTIEQIQQAGRDGKATIMGLQTQNATLAAQVNAATTIAAAVAVNWTLPAAS